MKLLGSSVGQAAIYSERKIMARPRQRSAHSSGPDDRSGLLLDHVADSRNLRAMRDPAEPAALPLKAALAILDRVIPRRDAARRDRAPAARPRFLEVRFVGPDGTERPYGQTRDDVAKVVDEQPINDRRLVTRQRLPLRAWCATPSGRLPCCLASASTG